MTRQEEIREYIGRITNTSDAHLDLILIELGEMGLVLKVEENRLPNISYHSAYPENEEIYQQAMIKAGYVAVESLKVTENEPGNN